MTSNIRASNRREDTAGFTDQFLVDDSSVGSPRLPNSHATVNGCGLTVRAGEFRRCQGIPSQNDEMTHRIVAVGQDTNAIQVVHISTTVNRLCLADLIDIIPIS